MRAKVVTPACNPGEAAQRLRERQPGSFSNKEGNWEGRQSASQAGIQGKVLSEKNTWQNQIDEHFNIKYVYQEGSIDFKWPQFNT